MKFKVGDRVRINSTSSWKSTFHGLCATISGINMNGDPHPHYNVTGLKGNPFYYRENELTLVPSNKIVITSDGTTTLARLYDGKNVIRTAKAVCNPSDTYDFATGANIAYDRLMHRAQPTATIIAPKQTRDEPKKEVVEKKEPIKLYCVKSIPGVYTQGKVYDFTPSTTTDSGYIDDCHDTLDDFFLTHDWLKENLVPLVKRPAKVGEWVYVTSGDGHSNKVNKIYRASIVHDICPGWVSVDNGKGAIRIDQYLVLDGYQPEPEKAEPEYYNGKVICVDDSQSVCFTKGKVYEFKNGFVNRDGGWNYDCRPMKDFTEVQEKLRWVKFIEHKGE